MQLNRLVADAFALVNLIVFGICVVLSVIALFGVLSSPSVRGAGMFMGLVFAAGPAIGGVLICGLAAMLADVMWNMRALAAAQEASQAQVRRAASNAALDSQLPPEIHPIAQADGSHKYRFSGKLYETRLAAQRAYDRTRSGETPDDRKEPTI